MRPSQSKYRSSLPSLTLAGAVQTVRHGSNVSNEPPIFAVTRTGVISDYGTSRTTLIF
jgi:hypothetical protein